tara:strand:+ start:65811 stop:66380 length:570 start_codon:yes stop_codon:yes gene_type:complete
MTPECKDTWLFINSFAPWLSAAGTVLISGIALWLSARDRKVQLRATFSNGVIPNENSHVLNLFVYTLSCVNVGPRQVSVTNYHWRYRKYPFTEKLKFYTFPYLDDRINRLCSKLPKQLSDGEQVLIFHPSDFFSSLEKREEFLFAKNSLTAFYRIMSFRLYMDTSIGKPVKVKIDWRWRRNLWREYKNS